MFCFSVLIIRWKAQNQTVVWLTADIFTLLLLLNGASNGHRLLVPIILFYTKKTTENVRLMNDWCFRKLSIESHRHELETELTGAQSHCNKGEICTSELSLYLGLSRLHSFHGGQNNSVWNILCLALRPHVLFHNPCGVSTIWQKAVGGRGRQAISCHHGIRLSFFLITVISTEYLDRLKNAGRICIN